LALYGVYRGGPAGASLPIAFTDHPELGAEWQAPTELDLYFGPEVEPQLTAQVIAKLLPGSLVLVESPPSAPTPIGGTLARPLAWWQQPAVWPLVYLGLIALTEAIGALAGPLPALACDALLLAALAIQGVSRADSAERALLCGLALAPLDRIYARLGALVELPTLVWEPLSGVVVVAAVLLLARALRLDRRALGLRFPPPLLGPAMLMVPAGFMLGAVQYLATPVGLLPPGMGLGDLALLLLVLLLPRGFAEELLFRGLLQRVATARLGVGEGVLFVTSLATLLQIESLAPLQVALGFGLALVFGILTWKSGTIALATIAHLSSNLSLYLLCPLAVAGIGALVGPPRGLPAPTPVAVAPVSAAAPSQPAPSASQTTLAGASPSPQASPARPEPDRPANPGPDELLRQVVVVGGTQGAGATLRAGPAASAAPLALLADYTPLLVTGPDQPADGQTWRPVRTPGGLEGWVSGTVLASGRESPPDQRRARP
jgi:CAAX protease family protein